MGWSPFPETSQNGKQDNAIVKKKLNIVVPLFMCIAIYNAINPWNKPQLEILCEFSISG